MNNKQIRKINLLSLDGGGIRGIIPAAILSELEAILRKKNTHDLDLCDCFDKLAGTSTGGILALGLTVAQPGNPGKTLYTASDLLDFYLTHGKSIFKKSPKQFVRSLGGIIDEKYDSKGMNHVMQQIFGDAKLSNLKKDVMIPAYDIKHSKPFVFSKKMAIDQPENDFFVWQVIRATSAMPTYFECAKIQSSSGNEYHLIDGGVFANNPSLYLLTEILKENLHKGNGLETIEINLLSLGTGEVRKQYEYKDVKNWGLHSWTRPLMDMMMNGVDDLVHEHLKQLFQQNIIRGKYYRINPKLTPDINPDMDDCHEKNISALYDLAMQTVEKEKNNLENWADMLLEKKDS